MESFIGLQAREFVKETLKKSLSAMEIAVELPKFIECIGEFNKIFTFRMADRMPLSYSQKEEDWQHWNWMGCGCALCRCFESLALWEGRFSYLCSASVHIYQKKLTVFLCIRTLAIII